MSQTASIWHVILAALVAANLPFFNPRWLQLGPLRTQRNPLALCLLEMVLLYFIVGGVALLLERLGALARWSAFRTHWLGEDGGGAMVLLALWLA